MHLKLNAINIAVSLMEILEQCYENDDDEFANTIVDAIYENDVIALRELEDRLYEYGA